MMTATVAAVVPAIVCGCAGVGVCAIWKRISSGEKRRKFLETGGTAVRAGGLVVIFHHADFRDFSAVGAFVVEQRHVTVNCCRRIKNCRVEIFIQPGSGGLSGQVTNA